MISVLVSESIDRCERCVRQIKLEIQMSMQAAQARAAKAEAALERAKQEEAARQAKITAEMMREEERRARQAGDTGRASVAAQAAGLDKAAAASDSGGGNDGAGAAQAGAAQAGAATACSTTLPPHMEAEAHIWVVRIWRSAAWWAWMAPRLEQFYKACWSGGGGGGRAARWGCRSSHSVIPLNRSAGCQIVR